MNARTAWFMQRLKQGSSSRLGWLYSSREEWTTACLLIEGGTTYQGIWKVKTDI